MVIVLFDLEGTLVSSIEDKHDAILEFRMRMANKLVELGIQPSQLEGTEVATLMLNRAFEIVDSHFKEKKALWFHREMDKFLKNFEMRWARQSKIFPDAISVLEKLQIFGWDVGLVTNTSKEAADHMLSVHGIKSFFKVIITRENVKRLKPDPEGVLLALKKLNGQEFFLVGDLAYDSIAAKKAGGVPIIVKRNPSKILKFQADFVIGSLEGVPDLVQNILKGRKKIS